MIQVTDLQFTYAGAEQPAVRGIDFKVERGEIFGFLGPNGAGKSTTQKILIGLLPGYQGEVKVMGRDRRRWNDRFYEYVGISFEFPNHYAKLTGLENLELFGGLYAEPKADPRALLEAVDLLDAADTRVSDYSKGMQVRLGIARALINEPELLFLDEPAAGLDPVSTRAIEALIQRQKELGRTVFLTTHNMAIADLLCDRVAFIVKGEISTIDSPRSLKLAHGQRKVRVEFRGGLLPGRSEETTESSLPSADASTGPGPAQSDELLTLVTEPDAGADDAASAPKPEGEGLEAAADAPSAIDAASTTAASPATTTARTLQCQDFPLEGLAENPDFLRLLREREIETIHTLEATLEDVFVDETGHSLR